MNTNRRVFGLPPAYEPRLRNLLKQIGFDLDDSRRLAHAIQQLSDYYTTRPDETSPWDEPWAQAASLAYYFPLNYSRAKAVAREATRLGFFDSLETVVDFGSGMGSALHAFADEADSQLQLSPLPQETQVSWTALDSSQEALNLGHGLGQADRLHQSEIFYAGGSRTPKLKSDASKSALIASYVLTELPAAPDWWGEFEALVIIEPSTQTDGRKLQAYRSELIEKGYRIWAPCTHEAPCPLLIHSGRDWCHDRIHFEAPDWFLAIERHLPMKNKTLTFSYLLARKSKAPPSWISGLGRLTGDTLEEKGKNRQSLCRGSEREFLSWFPPRLKKGEVIELERGNLVALATDLEKKSSEVRLKSPEAVFELSSTQKDLNSRPRSVDLE